MLKKLKYFLFLLFLTAASINISNAQNTCNCAQYTFVVDKNEVCAPAIVTFRTTGYKPSDKPKFIDWDFGDGNGFQRGAAVKSRLISKSGTYDIKVKFTFFSNSTCTCTKKAYLIVHSKENVKINISSPISCFLQDTITITDVSLNTVSREYVFDGKSYKDAPNPFKIAPKSLTFGPQSLYVIVKDSFGCLASSNIDTLFMQYKEPTFGVDIVKDKLCIGEKTDYKIKFSNTAQNLKKVKWLFHKGIPLRSDSLEPKDIKYDTIGKHNVEYTAETEEGCIYDKEFDELVYVGDTIPLVLDALSKKYCAGSFIALSTTGKVRGKYLWDFRPNQFQELKNEDNEYHGIFKQNGSYDLILKNEYLGCTTTKTFKDLFSISGPIAKNVINPKYFCSLPKSIKMESRNWYPVGVTPAYKWEVFDDKYVLKHSSTLKDFTPNIASLGKYYIRQIAGAGQCRDTTQFDSILGSSLTPSVKRYLIPVCKGKNLRIEANTKEGEPGVQNDHIFTFYDLDGSTILSTHNLDSANQIYSKNGLYNYKLVAYNSLGCRDSILFKNSIKVGLPEYELNLSKPMVCVGEIFTLYAKGKQDYNNTKNVWKFQHLDSANIVRLVTGDSVDVRVAYPGPYRVSLQVGGAIPGSCSGEIFHADTFWVNGTKYNVLSDKLDGCSPLDISLTTKRLVTYNFSKKKEVPTFLWSEIKKKKIDIEFEDKPNTKAKLLNNDLYNIKFVYSDESGCKDSTNIPTITSGVKSFFDFRPHFVCLGTEETLVNKSSLKPTGFKWYFDSTSHIEMTPSDSVKNPTIKFVKVGKVKVYLVAKKGKECADTFFKELEIVDISAEFTADSIQFCAPKIVTFRPKNLKFIYKMQWDFGDGIKDTLAAGTTSHVYLRNTPSAGVTASLIVYSHLKCNDTFVKPNYIKVIGPIAKYSLNNVFGCEPLTVQFINQSSAFNTAVLSYGDDSIESVKKFSTHTYRITTDKGKEIKGFRTKLLLKDTIGTGCTAIFSLPDSVFVLKAPENDFKFSKFFACAPARIIFNNRTVIGKPVDFTWDFDNDGLVDSKAKNGVFTFGPGVYYPKLISRNVRNCSDTLISKDSITIYKSPIADFSFSGDSFCSKDTVYFVDKSVMKQKATNWVWDFGELSVFTDISYKQHPSYKYVSPYSKIVSLTVTDEFGCSNKIEKSLYILDTIAPPIDGLWAVSVDDNKRIDIKWPQYRKSNFESYQIFDDAAGYTHLYLTKDVKDTSYIKTKNLELTKRRYCFSMQLHDSCGKTSPYSKSHCSVFLWIDKDVPGTLKLNWVHYEGWDLVTRYNIYRKEPGKAYEKINYVSGTTSQFIDSNLCDKEYCYYLEAVAPDEKTTSRSNWACETPDYERPTLIPQMLKATVVNGSYVNVYWKPYNFKSFRLKTYAIDRISKTSGGIKNFGYSSTTVYKDDRIDVDKDEFVYQVRAVDKCDHSSPTSGISSNILLNGQSIGNKAALSWSFYQKWASGVKQYHIQQYKDTKFVTIDSVENTINTYTVNGIDPDLTDSIKFRILAIKDSVVLDTSISNYSYIIPSSIIFVPTAFTPNKDGTNDIFKPLTYFINKSQDNKLYQYSFRVYNRWGIMIFETHNPDIGWDGTYLGNESPQDNYVYIVNAVGLDGIVQKQKGNFLLLR